MRKMPSSPSMTAVGLSTAAAKTAVRKASSAWLSSALSQPRSPACGAVDVSVETVLATSSQVLPPRRSRSAASALALAAAMAAGGRLDGAVLDRRLDLDEPGVALLRGGRLLDELGVDVGVGDGRRPPASARSAWSWLSMMRSSEIATICCSLLLDDLLLDVRLRLGQPTGDDLGPDAACGLVQPPVSMTTRSRSSALEIAGRRRCRPRRGCRCSSDRRWRPGAGRGRRR